jgi:hypothetical protein
MPGGAALIKRRVVRSPASTAWLQPQILPDDELLEGASPWNAVVVAMLDTDRGWAAADGSIWALDFHRHTTTLVSDEPDRPISWLELAVDTAP